MHSILKRSLAAVVAAGFSTSFAVADESQLSGELKITSDMSNPAPRAVMESLAAGFGELHPDVDIELTIVDREAWKTQIRNALGANPPDVVNWYAANRMGPYVSAGLFEDISDMYANGDLPGLESVKGALTIDGKQYGVPYTYYQWGMYYREDIFNELTLLNLRLSHKWNCIVNSHNDTVLKDRWGSRSYITNEFISITNAITCNINTILE